MNERRSRALKVHFQHNGNHRTLCGNDGRTTYVVNNTTCRVCMFYYLAESTSWARRFLDDLRGKPSTGETQRDKNLRERGYHITVGKGGDTADRKSPSITLEYIDAGAARATVRDVLGPAALGELGPLTPEQEADLERYAAHVRHVQGDLRKLSGSGQGHAVAVPAGAAEPMHGQEKGLGDGFARAFSQQRSPEKAVSHFLPFQTTGRAAVKEVVHTGGAPADAVGVQGGDVAEKPGDAG